MAELPRRPQGGDDIRTAFNSLMDFIRRERILSVVGGTIKQMDGGKTITVTPSRGGVTFSGTAYIAGNKTTNLNSDSEKPYVRCFLDTATAEEHAGPPPNPFPPNEEWYEKANTGGDIHITRS